MPDTGSVSGNMGPMLPPPPSVVVKQDTVAATAVGLSTTSDIQSAQSGQVTTAQFADRIHKESQRLSDLQSQLPTLEAAQTAGTVNDADLTKFKDALAAAQAVLKQAQDVLAKLQVANPKIPPNPCFSGGSGAFFIALMEAAEAMKENQKLMGANAIKFRDLERAQTEELMDLEQKIGDTEAEKQRMKGISALVSGFTSLAFTAGGATAGSMDSTMKDGVVQNKIAEGTEFGSKMGQTVGSMVGGIFDIATAHLDSDLGGYRAQQAALRDAYQNSQGARGDALKQFGADGDRIDELARSATQGSQTLHRVNWSPSQAG